MIDPTNPPPGHELAVKIGCICPCLDNNHGLGVENGDGKLLFWIAGDCPLHGKKGEEEC